MKTDAGSRTQCGRTNSGSGRNGQRHRFAVIGATRRFGRTTIISLLRGRGEFRWRPGGAGTGMVISCRAVRRRPALLLQLLQTY